MKHGFLFLPAVLTLFLCLPLSAQAPFFQPPGFSGSGNTFVADFDGNGSPDILTSDGTLNLGDGHGNFSTGTQVSGTPLAVADVNGDAKADIVEQGTGTLLVLLGAGDGTFHAAISTASGASLTNIVAADLNGDGKADVIGFFNNALLVYISNGDGTFAAPASYTLAAASNPSLIFTLGDFNGDGKTDIAATVDYNFAVGQEFVFLGNGDGTFQPAVVSAGLPLIQYAADVAAGDFNRDGKLDLAVSTSTQCHGICAGTGYILLGNADGTFQTPTVQFTSFGPLAAMDVNGDGKLDLITEPDPSVTIATLYLGNGNGTFSSGRSYVLSFASGIAPISTGIATADFNGDGQSDIAVANEVLLSNGNGTFQGVSYLNVQPSPAVAGDFDKNGTNDLATAFTAVNILNNAGAGVLSVAHTYSLPSNLTALGIVSADLNGDGNLDLVVNQAGSAGSSWSYSVLLGNGDGTFQSPVNYSQSTATGSYPLVMGDFNHDHKTDLVIAAGTSSLAILLGNGDGTFSSPVYYFDGGGGPLFVGDFNSDGKVDIIAGPNASNSSQPSLLLGNGDGTFAAATFPTSLTGFAPQFSADMNNDGNPDLISTNQIALGNGDGTFTLLPPLTPGAGISFDVISVGDLNNDGKPDLTLTVSDSQSPSHTGVLLGNGDGTFATIIHVTDVGAVPVVLISDMNGDNLPDLVFSWPPPGSITLLRGLGVLLSQGVQFPDFTVGPAPGTATSQTVNAGGSASYNLVFTPSTSFSGTVSLSCAITPVVTSAPSCSLSSSSLQLTNTGTQQVTVTIGTTTIAAAGMTSGLPTGTWALTILVSFLGTSSVWLWDRRRRVGLATALACAFLVCLGCGGGSSSHTNPGMATPTGTYTVAVTAASGTISHVVNLQLVVQ